MASPPGSPQAHRPDRRPGGTADDGARLQPGERDALERSVVRVGTGARRPMLAAILVAGAFLLGMLRPWDLFLASDVPRAPAPPSSTIPARPSATAGPLEGPTAAAVLPGDDEVALQQPTCGYPVSWRTATLQDWGGRMARIWTAVEAVVASGPADPSIPFYPVGVVGVEAIGWCAPVEGPERPPLTAAATLFAIRDGAAVELPVDRLEPAGPSALGELWRPRLLVGGRRLPWPEGSYVIRLADDAGSYVRYLGLTVGVAQRPTPPPLPASSAPASSTRPGDSPSAASAAG